MNERDLPSPLSAPALRRLLDNEARREDVASAILADEMDAAAAREPECKRRRDEAAGKCRN